MRRIAGWLSIIAAVGLSCPGLLSAQVPPKPQIHVATRADWANQPKYRQDQLLVRFRAGTELQTIAGAHAANRAQTVKTWRSVPGLQLVQLPTGSNLQSAILAYRRNPSVLYAEPNYILHALETVNDPLFPQQWDLQNTGQDGGLIGADIHVTQAWTQTTGSSNVVVAVLDTGIDYTHPDLAANVWKSSSGYSGTLNGTAVNCAAGTYGFNAVAGTCDPMDDNGHGTHVSGTIGAIGNNNVGVAGLNWSVQIMPCKFLDSTGSGTTDAAVTCLDFVEAMKDQGANVVATSNSWGGVGFSQALSDAIQAQEEDGILFVAAAGNESEDSDLDPVYPANFFLPNIIPVAATDRFDNLAYFSNVGLHSVYIGAPGQEILSTTPNDTYTVMTGTSMATPHVTGVAALLAAFNPKWDWRALRNLILAGGDNLPSLSSTVTGKRLDAYGSMTCANSSVESRLQPTLDAIAGAVGEPITLGLLNINCGQAAGPVSVAISPGGQTIPLVDDGTGVDLAAGDGIYTGQWIPAGLGNYTLTFPTGDSVDVTVLSNYSVQESAPNYQTIEGANLNLGDDNVATITSPFPIQFGGGSFTTLYISSNGTISFTNAFGDYVDLPLPLDGDQVNVPQNPPPPIEDQPVVTLLAPFWEDLVPVKGSNQNVFWDVTGTAPNRQLVIEWRNVGTYECKDDPNATVTFQTVFSEGSSSFQFNYSDVVFGDACSDQDYGNAATIGMQITQDIGTQWSYDQFAVSNGMSLLWTIPTANPTPNPVPTLTSISPSTLPAAQTGTVVTLTGTGFVPDSRVPDLVTTYLSATQLQVLIPPSDPAFVTVGGTESILVTNPAPGGGTSNSLPLTFVGLPPQITSISVSNVPAGSFGFILTINGSGFYEYSDVNWNGPTGLSGWSGAPGGQLTFISPNQVTVPIPDFLLVDPGAATLQIQNGPSVFSNTFPFVITAPAQLASPSPGSVSNSGSTSQLKAAPPPLPARFLGWKFAREVGGSYLAQFQRPRADLAKAVSRSDGVSGTSAQSGDSAASPPVPGFGFRPTLPADVLPSAVVTGDFNGDGKLDWAVANSGSNDLWIYLGNGDGTAQIPTIIPLRGQSPVALVAADMNHDGILDLVVAEADSGMIAVLLGKGNGTFAPEFQFAAPSTPVSLAVADFDGDGNPDVVAGLISSPILGALAFFKGDGTGRLSYPISRDTGVNPDSYAIPVSLSAADLNGDGLPDIVLVDYFAGALTGESLGWQALAYLSQGDGSFKFSQRFFSNESVDQTVGFFGIAATAVTLADVNKDGCIDAVTVDTTGAATFFPGLCDGTFDTSNARIFGTGIVAGAASLGDFNNDGNLDLVSSGVTFADAEPFPASDGNSLSVQFGDGTGNFGSPTLFRGESGMFSLAVADLAGNGLADIITANQASDSLSVYSNDGKGNFGGPYGAYLGYLTGGKTPNVAAFAGQFFSAADVNGDGHKDLVTLQAGAQYPLPVEVSVLLGDGTGNFAPPLRSPLFESDGCSGLCFTPADFALEDFRNVGVPDLITYGSGVLGYSKNNGDGTFQRLMTTQLGISSGYLVIGDFNGDGKLDLILLQGSGEPAGAGENVAIVPMLGNGDGTFTKGSTTLLGVSSSSTSPYLFQAQAADLNGDGKLDLLVLGNGLLSPNEQNALYEFIGNGDGTFQSPKLLFNNFSEFFAVADLNHDGTPDIVEAIRGILNQDLLTYPWQYQVFLGQSDGTFLAGSAYGPYSLPLAFGFFAGTPDKPLEPPQPLLADFNGDGNLDIAVYQSGVQLVPTYFGSVGGSTGTSVQILAGNGDGTFTPSSLAYSLGRFDAPELALDLNGDNRADLVETNGFTSSYDVIPSVPGASFLPVLVADPVVGVSGKLRIILAYPSSNATTFQISSSDPNISIPTVITVPAGSISDDISFQIGAGLNPTHVFAFTVTLGAEVHTAYGTQVPSGAGFAASMSTATPVIIATQSTPDYGLLVSSTGGYSTSLQFACQGLPVGASCQFGENSATLGPDEILENSLVINTGSVIAIGQYSFNVVVTDGLITVDVPGSFGVGDFTMSISPASQAVGTIASAEYTLSLQGIEGFVSPVQLAWINLPSGVSCALNEVFRSPASQGIAFDLNVANAVPGTYTFTVTGDSGTVVRSASAQIVISGKPSATGVASSLNSEVAGQSVTFTATVTSTAGGTPTGTVTFFNGTASLGGMALNSSGVATLSTSTLPIGTDSITASYVGDANYAASTSSPITDVVSVAGFAPVSTVPPVTAGQTAPINLTLYAAAGSGLNFTLGCVGLPSKSSCSFSENPVTPGTPPNGTIVQLTFGTSSSDSPTRPSDRDLWPWGMLGLSGFLAALLTAGVIQSRNACRRRLAFGVCLGLLLLAIALVGCAGGGSAGSGAAGGSLSYTGTPKGPATFTVTGTSGATTISTAVSITIQ